jgi:DNA-binding transcriptional LysR family regulator
MNVSFRQIEVFLAVAKTLSFSEAAKLCHLSQPALSANVKRLEETLGARLFDRHTRKVSLTAVGLEFFNVAFKLTETTEIAFARVQDFVEGKRGRLVVAAAPSMSASFVPVVIAEYYKSHKGIEIKLHDELSEVCIEMVRSGDADLALAPFKSDAEDLDQIDLFRDHLVVICRAGHSLSLLPQVRWRDVQRYAQVVMNPSSSLRQQVDAQYQRYGVQMRPAFEVAHVGTMLGLIAADLGVGALPESLIRNVDMKGLVHRRISSKEAYRTICAITLRNRSQAPPVAPFLEICKKRAKRFVT